MDTDTLIDNVLAYTDGVSQNDADNTTRRARILLSAQEVFSEVWNHAGWSFSHREANVAFTIAAGYTGPAPSDFQAIGKYGGLWDSTGLKWEERPFQEVEALRRTGQASTETVYSLFGQDATTGVRTFIAPLFTSNFTLIMLYKAAPPALTDAVGNSSKLQMIPDSYHHTVLLPGTVAKTRKSKGDGRDWRGEYLMGLAKMQTIERPLQTVIQRMPQTVGGKW